MFPPSQPLYILTYHTIWFTLGIKFLKKLKNLSHLAHYMGKYVKKAAHFHKNMLTLASSDALIEKFDELMLIWQRFDTLWRHSYGPPLQNESEMGRLLNLMNKTFVECKDLYNTCQLDLNSSAILQYWPLQHIIMEKGNAPNEEKEQKEQNN